MNIEGPNPEHHVLNPAGPQAQHIAELFTTATWLLGAVCVAVVLAVLFAVFRSRQRRDTQPEAVVQANPASERRAAVSVASSTVVTLLALAFLLVESIVTDRKLDGLDLTDAVHVQVIGKQWWWSVRYPADATHPGFRTANEIHIPVGRPVVLDLSASDVIHSVWIPNLHGKRDLIPGHDTQLALRADRPGRYRNQCAEFCGIQHAHMVLEVVAEPSSAFEAWRSTQARNAEAPRSAEAQHGQELFLTGSCAVCHSVSGTAARADDGPDLSHFASREYLAAGALRNTPEHLRAWIADSQHEKPGNRMPTLALDDTALRALVSYLEELR